MPEIPEQDAQELADYINSKAAEFAALRSERHAAGAEEYGQLTFLNNDVVRMMLEELADVANYCTMQGVKLLILQEQLEAVLSEGVGDEQETDIELGFKAFKGTKDVGWGRS